MTDRRPSDTAADREVLGTATTVVERLGDLYGLSLCASIVQFGRPEPEPPVVACDQNLHPRRGEHWGVFVPEDKEVHEYLRVTDWLAERLAGHGELVLLVVDEFYVWCRMACDHPIEDDLRFLDEPESLPGVASSTLSIDDPTEYDHSRIIEHRRSDP